MKHAFWGPSYDNKIVLQNIKSKNLEYKKFVESKELIQTAAKAISDGNVVGWYHGQVSGAQEH